MVASLLEQLRAGRVLLSTPKVLAAIHFYDQPVLRGTKIDHVSADSMLPPEINAAQMAASQQCPQFGLGRRRLRAVRVR
jgi:hypothetical protein